MFNLEQEIQNWCVKVFENQSEMDEAIDHLYCEIERLHSEGLTEEQAFAEATKRYGDAYEVRKELNKNRNLLIQFINLWRRPLTPKKVGILHIVVALLFVLLISIADFIVEQTQYEIYSESITNWLLALYMIPFCYLCTYEQKCQSSFCIRLSVVKQKVSDLLHRR